MKINLLVNLPEGFYATPTLQPAWARLRKLANLRRRSFNTADEIRRDLAWAEAVLMWSWPELTAELLDAAPHLKFLGHLDLRQRAARLAMERQIPVSVSRSGFSPAVAEMAMTLILSTLRKICRYHSSMRFGIETWVKSFPDDIDPLERQLTGRKVGIIGFGAIGRRLAELLAPFHCPLLVHDPFVPEDSIIQFGGKKAELMDLLRNSEVIVLAAASNPGTRHLLGPEQIAAIRKNAVLVNVARAALVDTDALVARLRKKKRPMFAAIDVFDEEPLPRNHPLRRLPNAYLTPHRAGGLMSSVDRIINWLIDDLENHLAGKPLDHPLLERMIPALDA